MFLEITKKSEWTGGVVGIASYDIKEPRNENGISYLPIEYNFQTGKGPILNDDSALVRSFRQLLVEGKPIRKINFIFYKEKSQYYTIGTMVNAIKNLIFFPGITISKVTESPPDEKAIKDISLNIDHLTLEENWNKWHFTFKEENKKRKHKLTTRKTKKINGSLTLWFVMAIQSLNKLEEMPKTQEYKLIFPNDDELKRRYSEFIEARNGVNFPIIEVKGEPKNTWYLNLEFFLGKKTSENYKDDYVKPPTVYTANRLSSNKGKPIINLYSRDIHVHLPGFDGRLWIRASRCPGLLDKDAFYIPGTDYN